MNKSDSKTLNEFYIVKRMIEKNRQDIIEAERIARNKKTEIRRLEIKLFKICNHIWVKDWEDRCSRCFVCSKCGLPNLPHVYS